MDKNELRNLAFVLSVILFFFISMCIGEQVQINELKEQDLRNRVIIDSINCELENSNNIITRYEITLEYLNDIDSNAVKIFENHFKNNTE
jgi:hypothetical protein